MFKISKGFRSRLTPIFLIPLISSCVTTMLHYNEASINFFGGEKVLVYLML